MILPVLLSLVAGAALVALGFVEGMRATRRRFAREDARWDDRTEPATPVCQAPQASEVRPQFCSPASPSATELVRRAELVRSAELERQFFVELRSHQRAGRLVPGGRA